MKPGALTSQVVLFSKLQHSVSSLQVFQLLRYSALLMQAVILAWLFPDKGLIGEYETLVLLGASLNFFWLAGLYDAFIPLYKANNEKERPALIRSAFRAGMAASTLMALAGALIALVFWPQMKGAVILCFSIFTCLNNSGTLLENIWVVEGRGAVLVLAGGLYYAVCLFVFTLTLGLGADLEVAIAGVTLVAALRWGVMLFWIRASLFGPVVLSKQNLPLNMLLRLAAPVSLSLLLGGSATYIDSYIVRTFFTTDEFVNFTYGARELPIALLLVNALSLVKSGEIAFAVKNTKGLDTVLQEFRRSGLRLMHFLFPVSAALLLVSAPLFRWVFGESFGPAHLIFDISLLLLAPRLLMPQALVKGHLQSWILLRVSMVELLLNVICSLALMQVWGIKGIAAGTVIAYSAEKVLLAIYCKQNLGIGLGAYTHLPLWTVYTTGLLIIFFGKLYWMLIP